MRIRISFAVALAAAAIVGSLFALSCTDADLTAPTDGTIVLRANPSTIVIDPNNLVEDPPGSGTFVPQTQGSSTLVAQVFDSTGQPLQNIAVLFSTAAGTLGSGGQGGSQASSVKTDSSGIAQDTLTIRNTDPNDIEVSATSSSISTKITVKKSLVSQNRDPSAAIITSPREKQAVGKPVIFDGTASVDPDDDPITMYRWSITSDNPDPGRPSPFVVEGPSDSALELTFQNVQNLVVNLRVTDEPNAAQLKQQGLPIPYSAQQATTPYQIVRCAGNQAPTARISGADPILVFGTPGQNQTVVLDGTTSSDPEGFPLAAYNWNCGNNSIPIPQGDGSKAACTYRVQSVTVEYTATLVVLDRGATGQIDPVTGNYCDQKASAEDSVKVRVSPQQ